MKDFYDVFILMKNNEINNVVLQEAIFQTFKNRNVIFGDNHPLFSESFCEDHNLKARWKAFLRKMKISGDLEFSHVVKTILTRLQPIYNDLSKSMVACK